MFTLVFWKSVAERSVATFGESFLAFLLVSGVTTLTGVDWVLALNTAGLAALIAVIKNILTGHLTDGSPSATNTETLKDGRHEAP